MSSALSTLDRPGTWPPIGAAARPARPIGCRVSASIQRVRELRRERLRRRFAAAIMVMGLAGAVVSGAVAYRSGGPHGERAGSDPRVRRVYDPATGKLTMVAFAADGSLRIDHWCYMDGERLLRMDVDEDRDGRVDRREYYGEGECLERTEYLEGSPLGLPVAETPGGRPFRAAENAQGMEAGK